MHLADCITAVEGVLSDEERYRYRCEGNISCMFTVKDKMVSVIKMLSILNDELTSFQYRDIACVIYLRF